MRNLSLRVKLVLSFLGVALLLGIVGGAGIFYMKNVSRQLNEIVTVNIPKTSTIEGMRKAAADLARGMTQLGLKALEKEYGTIRAGAAKDFDIYENLKKAYVAVLYLGPDEESLYNAADKAWIDLQTSMIDLVGFSLDPSPASIASYDKTYVENFQPSLVKYNAKIDELSGFHQRLINDKGVLGMAEAKKAIAVFTVSTVLGVLFAIGLGVMTSYGLSNSLLKIVQQILHEAQKLDTASISLSDYSSELSQNTSEQGSALQRTASAMEQVSAMVQRNSDNAKQSQTVSSETRQATEEGRRSVDEMIHSMGDIDQSNKDIMSEVERSNVQISEIVGVIAEIESKTKVINEIVFQTKLLSFNASVEAARAGEYGKGFAVVAEEVGQLAQTSGEAAKQISTMLAMSIKKVEDTINLTREKVDTLIRNGAGKVQAGVEVAKRCAHSLDGIAQRVNQLDTMIAEVARASVEQSQGITEVNQAINQLEANTKQSSGVAQKTSESSEDLKGQSQQLGSLMGQLNVVLNGANSTLSAEQMAGTLQTAEHAIADDKYAA